MEIKFDHCYTSDQNFRFRRKLEKAGFKLSEHMVEHPGKHFCKFIMMPRLNGQRAPYVEFVHVGKGGRFFSKPGLSFAALDELQPFANKLISKNVKAKFVHKNYEWKKNSVDRLPGWNFVDFPKHKSKILTWMTEYEAIRPRRKLLKKNSSHPNQVFEIIALDLILNQSDLSLYLKLGAKRTKDGLLLNRRTKLTFRTGKQSRLNAVIFASKDLARAAKKFEWDELICYQGMPGIVIKNPDKRMWDVVIVQG